MQLNVEYLVIIEKKATEALYHLCNSTKEFNRLLQSNPDIKIIDEVISFQQSIACDYIIKGGKVEGKEQRFFYLKITFNDEEAKISEFVNLLRGVKTSIHNADVKPETLWDDVSLYYSNKAYPIIHRTESLMRKLITYFMLTNVGKEWVSENLPKNLRETLKKSKRPQYLDVLHQVDFIDLGDFLFKNYPTNRVIEHLYRDLDQAGKNSDLSLDSLKNFIPRSNWDRYFSEIVDSEDRYLKERWEELYDLRCKVAHNALITRGDFEQICKLAEQIHDKLQKALDNLDQIHVPEEAKDQLAESVASSLNSLYGEFILSWNESIKLINNTAFSLNLLEDDHEATKLGPRVVYLLANEDLITHKTLQDWKSITKFRNELVHGANVSVGSNDIREFIDRLQVLTNEVLAISRNINLTWKEEIALALEKIGGEGQLAEIYQQIESETNRELGKTWKATVRYTLQVNADNTANGTPKGIFTHIDKGIWGLSQNYNP